MQRSYKIIFLFFFIYFYCAHTKGQSIIVDSLRKGLERSEAPKEKLNYLLGLFEEKATLAADSLMHYAQTARQIAETMNDEIALLESENMIAHAYHKQGKNDSCLLLADEYLAKKFTDPKQQEIQRKFKITKGIVLNVMNESKKAQRLSFELLKESESSGDKFAQVCALNLIGWSHLNLSNDSIAIIWFYKSIAALPGDQTRTFVEMRNIVEGNLGIAYWSAYRNSRDKKQLDSAIEYTNGAIKLARKHSFVGGLAFHLGNLSLLVSERDKDYRQAEKLLKEALSIREEIGNPYMIIMDMAKMGELYLNSAQFDKGITICKQAIRIADSAKIRSDMLWLYDLLAKTYRSAGKHKEYGETMYALMLYKDSMSKVNQTEELFDIQGRYESQKKEATIANQKLKIIRRNLFVYGSIALLLAVLVTGFLIFRNYRRKQKLKMQVALEEEKRLAGTAVKEAEDKERKRIAADLHDNLGVQANAILYNTELLQQEGAEKEGLVGDLHETAKEMLLNLRETLWAMKTTDIMAPELWLRIINFSQQMGRHYTQIKFSTEGNAPPDLVLPSAKALHVVMMIQEAVNNAVKHSHAKQVVIKSGKKETGWLVQVKDDGEGFDMQEAVAKKDSHGLNNIKERARIAGVKVEIETSEGKGTNISITL